MKPMLLEALIVLLPTALAANINVNIVASNKESERQSQASGSESNVIDYTELETFQLYDGKLRDAINIDFGKKPDDVYIKSRTPWGDLYTTYDWPQVDRHLKAVRTEIFSVNYKSIDVLTKYFNNTSPEDIHEKINLKKEVENVVESEWQENSDLVGIVVHYDVNLKSSFGDTAISYDSRWGENVRKTNTVTIGDDYLNGVLIKSGQRLKAVLKATIGELKVRVHYEASLSGYLAINYNIPFKGHHFYAMDVNSILVAGELKQTPTFSEVMDIKYYSSYEMILQDVDTKQIIN